MSLFERYLKCMRYIEQFSIYIQNDFKIFQKQFNLQTYKNDDTRTSFFNVYFHNKLEFLMGATKSLILLNRVIC